MTFRLPIASAPSLRFKRNLPVPLDAMIRKNLRKFFSLKTTSTALSDTAGLLGNDVSTINLSLDSPPPELVINASPLEDPMSTCSKVFSILELFEAILLNVDMRTILVSCQRVCRTWYTNIKSSHVLQRELYFLPDHTSPGPPFTFNPLLREAFNVIYPKGDIAELWTRYQAQVEYDMRIRAAHEFAARVRDNGDAIHPPSVLWAPEFIVPFTMHTAKMIDYGLQYNTAAKESSIIRRHEEFKPESELYRLKVRQQAFIRPGASWRRMYLSRPAARTIAYELVTPATICRGGDVRTRIVLEDGLKMGELWDEIIDNLMRGPGRDRWCRWTYGSSSWNRPIREVVQIGWTWQKWESDGLEHLDIPWIAERRRDLADVDMVIGFYCCDNCLFRNLRGTCFACERQRPSAAQGKTAPLEFWSWRRRVSLVHDLWMVMCAEFTSKTRLASGACGLLRDPTNNSA